MKNTYVLDTNILLNDTRALQKFKEHDIILPMVVIEEIDSFKKESSERGYAAREISRVLDDLRKLGSLQKGVELPSGGILKVFCTDIELTKNDNYILRDVLTISRDIQNVVLVSSDTNMRLKGDALGVKSEDYQSSKIVSNNGAYQGFEVLNTDTTTVDRFFEDGYICNDYGFLQNQFIMVKNGKSSGLGQVRDRNIVVLNKLEDSIWGLKPKNKEQMFALHALLDNTIKLVTISGVAGTGKTVLAIAAGLHNTLEKKLYHKMLVSRPIFPMGKDIGYLPGDISEKLNPWMKPIYDNLEFLLHGYTSSKENRRSANNYQYLFESGILEVEPLTYIRGRSIPNQFLLIDEAQNLTSHEIKTIITRAGENTKIVLVGDPDQIDNPYIDSQSNGLTYLIEHFKGDSIFAHITLTRGERSELATLASKLL